jgi:hypothetical protein
MILDRLYYRDLIIEYTYQWILNIDNVMISL